MSGLPLEETGTSSTAGTTLRQIYVFTPDPSILPRPFDINTADRHGCVTSNQAPLVHKIPGCGGIHHKGDAVVDMDGMLLGLGDSSTLSSLHFCIVLTLDLVLKDAVVCQ